MGSVQAYSSDRDIRVGIWANQRNILVSADTDYQIVNADNHKLLEHLSANEKATIVFNASGFTLNGKRIDAVRLSILKLKNDNEHSIEINKKQYRGDIDIHITNGKTGMTVVNTLPIEEYLYGIIAKEISPNWSLEAVKAQAVAARTYALYNRNKHKDDGYDVCATTDCQVYGGRESEVPRTIKAVDSTVGQVILYQGKLIPAYFHSSSGGFTENSENVWGTYLPYLRGVVDYDQKSPQYNWEKQLTPSEIEEALSKAGYNIGTLKAIGISPLTTQSINIIDRGVSGRVKIIRFIGTNGSIQLSGEKLRKILSLKSTLFDVHIILPVQKSIEFEITDKVGNQGSKKIEINLPPTSEKGFVTDRKDIHRISGRPNEIVSISGYGWGHGIGLSQWGAKAMAEKGPQDDPTYFKEILKHYYQGVEIKKLPKGV
ncbi:MAG: SpoIID/LytB domain protein [Pelosinus sp.]|jgi:stage II sporulation protein D|nr:SpoIID/LytB domain protein [Pelosinus sp.]